MPPDNPDTNEDSSSNGITDTRLILVTDLGFIVKQSKDGTRDVFVESIRSGLPVEGASIQAIGKNGQAVLDSHHRWRRDGRTWRKLPDLKREKSPLMILAQKDSDLSFMPYRANGANAGHVALRYGRRGECEIGAQLSAYLFSDRGIYRPGETTHLG